MNTRLHSFADQGLLLRGLMRRRICLSVSFGEIRSAERLPSGRGFRLHGPAWERLRVFVRRTGQRAFEERLRLAGVVIVDQWGARIDRSQFEKEKNPEFNRKVDDGAPSLLLTLVTPNFILARRGRGAMRQWSDDGSGE